MIVRAKVLGDIKGNVFSGHSKAILYMNAWHLGWFTKDLPRLDKIPSWTREVDKKSHPYLRSYWQLGADWRKRVSFYERCSPGEVDYHLVKGRYQFIWAALIVLGGLKEWMGREGLMQIRER